MRSRLAARPKAEREDEPRGNRLVTSGVSYSDRVRSISFEVTDRERARPAPG
jgi:hypothetical protein